MTSSNMMDADGSRYSTYERDLVGGHEVGAILDEAEVVGAITYEKPRSRLRREDEGGRDLFAHAVLYESGWHGFTVLDERNSANTPADEWSRYKKSVDLITSTGEYWEIKSPPPGENPTSTRAVERGLRRAEDQFAGHPIANAQPRRVVFNSRYLHASDDAISRRIVTEMRLQNISEVIHVKKNGTMEHHRLAA